MLVAKGKMKPCWMLGAEEWEGGKRRGNWSGDQNNPNPKSNWSSFIRSHGEGIHMKFCEGVFCINAIMFGAVMTEQGETKENYSISL